MLITVNNEQLVNKIMLYSSDDILEYVQKSYMYNNQWFGNYVWLLHAQL